jgi:hypothetical protein
MFNSGFDDIFFTSHYVNEREGQPAATGFKSKNLEAERRRRGRLNNNILALRAVVPNITKVKNDHAASTHMFSTETVLMSLNKKLKVQSVTSWFDLSAGPDEQGAHPV